MKKIALIPNIMKDKKLKVTASLIGLLCKEAEILMADTFSGAALHVTYLPEEQVFAKADGIIVLGGDGTMLLTARKNVKYGKPLLGINLGHLGFMTELEKESFSGYVKRLLSDEFLIQKRMMIDVVVLRGNEEIGSYVGLNDGVINCASFTSRIIEVSEFIDGEFVDRFPADGVVVATPTGSTAYSLSAGGPIASPEMEVMILTPICAHTMHSRPVVVSKDSEIVIQIDRAEPQGAALTVDGQESCRLEKGDLVRFRKSKQYTGLIKFTDDGFYKLLRYKLSGRE